MIINNYHYVNNQFILAGLRLEEFIEKSQLWGFNLYPISLHFSRLYYGYIMQF